MEWWQTALSVLPAATVVSVAVTLFVRWADRARPVLAFEVQLTRSSPYDKHAPLVIGTVAVINGGDGSAFNLEFFGDGCDVAVYRKPYDAHQSASWAQSTLILRPGDTELLTVGTPRDAESQANLIVRWDVVPGRPWSPFFKRIRRVRIDRLQSAMPFPVGMFAPEPIPRWFRRWRKLSGYSERGRMREAEEQRTQVNDQKPTSDHEVTIRPER